MQQSQCDMLTYGNSIGNRKRKDIAMKEYQQLSLSERFRIKEDNKVELKR